MSAKPLPIGLPDRRKPESSADKKSTPSSRHRQKQLTKRPQNHPAYSWLRSPPSSTSLARRPFGDGLARGAREHVRAARTLELFPPRPAPSAAPALPHAYISVGLIVALPRPQCWRICRPSPGTGPAQGIAPVQRFVRARKASITNARSTGPAVSLRCFKAHVR
jgi:hypothetical protein